MYCDIDNRNSDSNFVNLYHKPVLLWEQRVQDEWHEDLGFRVELPEIYGTLTSLTIVSKSQAHLPNSYYVEKEDEFIEEDFSVDWASPPIGVVELPSWPGHPQKAKKKKKKNRFWASGGGRITPKGVGVIP